MTIRVTNCNSCRAVESDQEELQYRSSEQPKYPGKEKEEQNQERGDAVEVIS